MAHPEAQHTTVTINDAQAASQRKPYGTPKLTVYGSIKELTLGDTGSTFDADTNDATRTSGGGGDPSDPFSP